MIRNYPILIWLPNIFASVAWLFAIGFAQSGVYPAGSPDEAIAIGIQFKSKLFFNLTILLASWNLLNEYVKCVKLNKPLTILDWLVRWITIPSIVLFLVISNDVFKLKIINIDWNFSAIPILLQMLVILILTEILKIDFFCRENKLNKNLSILMAFILGSLNFYFCMYFTFSWIAVHRN